MFTLIQFTLINRQTGARTPCWIESVSFKDGDGFGVKRMRTTRDRQKAARFSPTTAHEIAVQFSQYPASLVSAKDGAELVAETLALREAQAKRHTEYLAAQADIAQVFAEALRSIGR